MRNFINIITEAHKSEIRLQDEIDPVAPDGHKYVRYVPENPYLWVWLRRTVWAAADEMPDIRFQVLNRSSSPVFVIIGEPDHVDEIIRRLQEHDAELTKKYKKKERSVFVENVENLATGRPVCGRELMYQYRDRAKAYRYGDLPDPAKKALTQYMVIEGENAEYKKQRYGYVEVPIDDLMRMIYDQLGEGQTYDEFWGQAAKPSREIYNEIWPIIWGNLGWEDGAHRLEVYRGIGLKMIPVVVIL